MNPRMIIVGLGNPGRRYRSTRHNLGFMVVDELVARQRGSWSAAARAYESASARIDDCDLLFVKPQTYMNRSGRALRRLYDEMTFELDELLVVADDIALPWGQLRLRRQGSHGGHNGLRSIMAALASRGFARLRLGVGPVADEADPADFVLERFDEDEQAAAERMVERAADCVEAVLHAGFDRAMSRYNVAEEPKSD